MVLVRCHARHEANRLWESHEPESYAFDYSHCGGMCAQCTLRITVTAGRVSDVVRRDSTCSDYQVDIAPTADCGSSYSVADFEVLAPR